MWSVEILVMAVMIAVNSVFAAYEIALASISVSRLHVLQGERRRGARAAVYMKENMEGSLAAVQLGITLVGAIAAATGGAGAEEILSPWLMTAWGLSPGMSEFVAIALVVAPLTIITIIFGELIPKVFALRNKEWVCLRLSPSMRWFMLAVWPVVWFLEGSVTMLMRWGARHWQQRLDQATKTEAAELQELRASVALARTSRLIGAREEKIILGAAALTQRALAEIMLPAGHISMIDVCATVADALVTAHLEMHTRFPVTQRLGDPQGICGYVNFKDLVAHMRLSPHDGSLHGIVREMPRLPGTLAVSEGLEKLIRDRTHIALVTDNAGEVLGMVTLEDIIEELVGDIEDEYDRLPAHAIVTGRGWIVGGGMSLKKLAETTGLDLTSHVLPGELRSISDWIQKHLTSPVRGGEVVEREGVRAVVRKVRRQKVLEAQLEPVRAKADGAAPPV